jgi:hypothetical protein
MGFPVWIDDDDFSNDDFSSIDPKVLNFGLK